ncbi:hypothetical protein [Chromobacterium sphagni]|uniref:hypothetical protein n=1 Tax=Chromobacterium sphagni TaxID=1903179 RepID=UPI0013017BE4|nr:hypothetical protein [Chromobacterium sphagni]
MANEKLKDADALQSLGDIAADWTSHRTSNLKLANQQQTEWHVARHASIAQHALCY